MCSHIQIYFKYENVSNKRLKIIIFVKYSFFIRTSKNFDEGQRSYFWMISVTIFLIFLLFSMKHFLPIHGKNYDGASDYITNNDNEGVFLIFPALKCS